MSTPSSPPIAVPPPSADRFYARVAGSGRPGTPVRLRQVTLPRSHARSAWQLVYRSTTVAGRPVAMSGTVLMPLQRQGCGALLGYGAGVHGLGRNAAPSYLLRLGQEPEHDQVEAALDRGLVVLVPDGEGLGMPGPHTYGAGEPGGYGMLDLVRAARRVLPEIGDDDPIVLWGYSEGGRCAAFAAELQPGYASELPVRAVAAGGVPADLREVARAIDAGPFSGLALAVLIGLATAYDDADLWSVLTAHGRQRARQAATRDVVGLVLEHPESLAELTGDAQPWDQPGWARLLVRENAGQRPPRVPAYLYHASADEIVPIEVGRRLARSWTRLGATVTWTEIPAADHLSGAAPATGAVLDWLDGHLC